MLSIIVQAIPNSSMIRFAFLFSETEYTFNAPADSYVTTLWTHQLGSEVPTTTIGNLVVSFVSRLDQIVVSTPTVAVINNLNSNSASSLYSIALNANFVSLDDYYPKLFEEEPEP